MDVAENKCVWLIDPVHTRIRFEAKYLLLTSVSGWFAEFEGTVVSAKEDFTSSEINLTIYTNSITTGNEERDNHLRSPDFFNTQKFPIITFKSSSTDVSGKNVAVVGNLCIKDITETINFDALYVGSIRDPIGNLKAGFDMKLTLNRKDFGITWNQFFDQTGILLSDEINVLCDVQLLRVA